MKLNRPPRLSEAVTERLAQMRHVFSSGISEETGRLIRDPDTREVTGRIGGVKPAFPELAHEKAGPKAIAAALARGKGKLFRRIQGTVRDDLGRFYSDPKQRAKRQGSVGPHEPITAKCHSCGEYHGKGKHASHGAGSFHRTHLFAFNPSGATMNKWKRCSVCGAPVRGASMHGKCSGKRRSKKARRNVPGVTLNPQPAGDYKEFHEAKYTTTGARKQIAGLMGQGWEFERTIVYPSGTVTFHLVSEGKTAILNENGTIKMLYPVGTVVHDALKSKNVKQGYGAEPNPSGSTLIGSRTVAVVYQRFKGHKCNAACKRAGHQYVHKFKKGTPTPLSVSADRKTVIIGKRR